MTTPYQILSVSPQATDSEIKLAYLQKVKENPPDRDRNRFQEIQEAYAAVKDQHSRLSHALFHVPSVEFDELLAQAFRQDSALPAMPADDFLRLLNAVPLEKSLLSAFTTKS